MGEVCVARAPGRVNLMGDHTDYTDGFALPMTLGCAVYVALRHRDDGQVRLFSANFEEEVHWTLREGLPSGWPEWADYAGGVADTLRRRGLLSDGFEGIIYGDVPLGAGLSSSAALEVAVAVGLEALFGLDLEPADMARLCQEVEHTYVGVECGIMDQFTARLGRARHALFLDCRSLEYSHIPLDLKEVQFVIADSGASRALAGSKYNERCTECEEATHYFQQRDASVRALRDVSPGLLDRYGAGLPGMLQNRCLHVVEENRRVRDGSRLLRDGQFEVFGRLMNASHASLRDLYEVSSPELDALVEIAQQTEGVLGARMTGAGFGGCTVSLVRREAVPVLKQRVHQGYREAFGREAFGREAFGREPNVYVLEDNVEAGML